MPYFELTLYNLLLVGRKGKGGPSSGKAKKAVNVAGEFRNYTTTCLSAYTYICTVYLDTHTSAYFELTLYNLLLVGRKGKGGPSSGKAKKPVNVAGEFRNYTTTCLSA